jgi:DNA-binding MarR family transcriptional regulator
MQLTLIPNEPVGRHRKHDPETAKTAARSIKPRLLESLVLGIMRSQQVGIPYGMTTSEIANATGLPRDSISPRMKPMEQRGLVVRTSERRDGRIVWRLA